MYRNFVEYTKRFFKSALSKRDDDSAKWKTIENYIKETHYQIEIMYNTLHWDTNASSREYCEVLLNLIKNHRCNNKILIIFLTDLITIFTSKHLDLTYCVNNNENANVKSAINNLENDSEISIFAKDEGIYAFTALLGNYQFMEVLVKYGLVKNFSRECPFLKTRTMEMLRDLFSSVLRDDDAEVYELIQSSIFKVTGDHMFTNKTGVNFKRVLFTTLAFQAVIYKLEHDFFMLEVSRHKLDNYIRCLRLYFKATSDPCVTLTEMKVFLQVWLRHVSKPDLESRYYETYKELMPESTENFQPRKLTELCRIQVREYLSSYLPLPMAIENANLPEKLKDFISFNFR